jgi:hypothetical protein
MTSPELTALDIGGVWAVPLIDGVAVLTAGPFAAAPGHQEFLAVPLYRSDTPDFRWSAEDMRIGAGESPLDGEWYAALWNARPILARDLGLQLGRLSDEAISDLRDLYWASLNETDGLRGARVGRTPRWWWTRRGLRAFQAREMDRWQILSGRVMTLGECGHLDDPCEDPEDLLSEVMATLVIEIDNDGWVMGRQELDALEAAIAKLDGMIEPSPILHDAPGQASLLVPLSTTVRLSPAFFDTWLAQRAGGLQTQTVSAALRSGQLRVADVGAANSELALAA